jgi:hypothetical protein
MATVSQRLAFLISANADQAIKAFDKTANAAEKQMGKATKSIDKVGANMTKFGAAGLAAAGTLGAGLFKLAQGAIDDQKAQALLAQQMKATTGATNAQVAAVEDLIDQTARATGVADDELRPAYATLLRATGDVTKAQGLLQTALNVSAGSGKDLGTVVSALGKAATGNVGALQKLGIPIDANAKKAKNFNLILDGLNQTFAGASAAAADTYAGKLARTKVALSEAGEEIGSAFIPVIELGAKIVTNAVGAFDELNKTTGGLAGKLATIGTVSLGALSGISLLGGQAIKLRTSFLNTDAATGKLTGGLTSLGKGVVGAAAVIGVATVVYNAYSKNKAAAEKTTMDLVAALKLEGDAQKNAVRELVVSDDRVKRLAGSLNLLGMTFGDVQAEVEGNTKQFGVIREALDKYFRSAGTGIAQQRAFADAIGYTGTLTNGQILSIKNLVIQIDAMTSANKNTTTALDSANKALADNKVAVDDGRQANLIWVNSMRQMLENLDKAKIATEENKKKAAEYKTAQEAAAAAAKVFKDNVMGAASALKDKLNTALKAAEDNAKKAKDEFDAYAKSIADAVMGTISLGNAQATANSNTEKVSEAQKKVAETLTALNLARASGDTEKIADATQAWSDATKDLATAQKAPQTFMDVLRGQAADAKKFGENLLSLKGLGLSEAAFNQIAGAGAEAGNQIAEGILSGANPAGKVAEINGLIAGAQTVANMVGAGAAATYKQNGVDLANSLLAGVTETVAKYKLKLTWKGLKGLGKPIKTIAGLTEAFGKEITGQFEMANVDVPAMANGGIVNPRTGGTMVRVGEAGKSEAIVPLPAGGLGGSITINVNAGLGADGSKIGQLIVDELQAYQRRVGSLPLKVSA